MANCFKGCFSRGTNLISVWQDNPFRRAMRRRDRRSNTSSEDTTSVSSSEGSASGTVTVVTAEHSADPSIASTRGLFVAQEKILGNGFIRFFINM